MKTIRFCFSLLLPVGCLMLIAGILMHGGEVSRGVIAGISTCVRAVIPSLFPFMVVAGFLSCSSAGALLARLLAPAARFCFALPCELGFIVVMSAVGGYPVGAKLLQGLLEQRRISPKTAQRMLCFCCNAGPSFVVTAVGVGVFGNRQLGWLLLAAQLAASLLLGVGISLGTRRKWETVTPHAPLPAGEALVAAVAGSVQAMLTICGYVVLFSGLMQLLQSFGFFSRLASLAARLWPGNRLEEAFFYSLLGGLLEVTGGCLSLSSAAPGRHTLALAAFLLAFSGLSVLFQIRAILAGYGLSFRPFYLSRVLHGLLSAGICGVLLHCFPGVAQAAAQIAPVPVYHANTPLLSLCLVGMSLLLLRSLREGEHPVNSRWML